MRRGLRASLALVLTLAMALAFVEGCVSGPESELTLVEWMGVRSLAVAPGPDPTEVKLWAMNARTGAEVGMVEAMDIATRLTLGLWPLAFYGAGAVCVPLLGAGIGAIVGAIQAPPDDEIAPLRGTLFEVITPACLPQVILDGVVERGTSGLSTRTLTKLEAVAGETASDRARSIANRGVDAILEITIESIEVSGPWGTNPDGGLLMRVRYQLVSTRDGVVLFEGSHLEQVDAEKVGRWWKDPTDKKPEPTRELANALLEASKATATAIASAVFRRGPVLPSRAPPSEPSASE